MSTLIHKSHNVSVLMYHFVCPTKYRRAVINDEVDKVLREVCEGISSRYEIEFIEIGADNDHVHFLIQSVPTLSPTQIIMKVKSITAIKIFKKLPWLKKELWGSAFWSSGFFVNSVGRYADENVIRNYVASQGREPEFKSLYVRQLDLFAEPTA
jgi:putative transposase